MLNHKEIKTINELKKIIDVDDGHCRIPLFHGTRRYALQASDADRERFKAACKQVLSFANKFYYSGKINWDKLESYYQTGGNHYFLSTVVHQYNSALYEYGNFYLTTSYENAIGFAHNVGGEAGAWAHAQLQGFEDWGIELDEATEDAAEIIRQEYKKYHDSEKVLLVYYGVSFEDLCTEGGKPFLLKTADKTYDEAVARKRIALFYKDGYSNNNFRLSNVHVYTAYMLPERMFRDGVVLFENEPDVDKFIRSHNSICLEKWSF